MTGIDDIDITKKNPVVSYSKKLFDWDLDSTSVS